MKAYTLDKYDRDILRVLQEDADLPLDELSERIGLSKTPCWNRIKKLKDAGFISKTTILIDPKKIGLHLRVVLAIELETHNSSQMKDITDALIKIPQIIRLYKVAGQCDLYAEVLMENMEAYSDLYQRILTIDKIVKIVSYPVLQEFKSNGMLDLD